MSSKYQAILDELNNAINGPHSESHAVEPTWLMRILQGSHNLTTSPNKGQTTGAGTHSLEHFCPIYDYQFGLSRIFNPESMSNDLVPGGLIGHELKIVAPFASINPQIHAAFSQNTIITSVLIARVATISNTIATNNKIPVHILSEYNFSKLYITAVVSKNDLISLAFRYTDVHYKKHAINPSTGTHSGSDTASYHNMANAHAPASEGNPAK